ncbi:hypothetical protein K438DRAFT_1826236 [Mycena galopus ATCC 62051]|nr:hypothetical protein K438DRAFT_1826236 [Mycena galopus ATCC 62051]
MVIPCRVLHLHRQIRPQNTLGTITARRVLNRRCHSQARHPRHALLLNLRVLDRPHPSPVMSSRCILPARPRPGPSPNQAETIQSSHWCRRSPRTPQPRTLLFPDFSGTLRRSPSHTRHPSQAPHPDSCPRLIFNPP